MSNYGILESKLLMPPYTLGPCTSHNYKMHVYSEIWGIDPVTQKPREYEVSVDVSIQGQWANIYVSGCIQPAAPLRKNNDDDKIGKQVGDHLWMWDEPQDIMIRPDMWDDNELTGFPDRIYFKECLPKELLSVDLDAKEFPVHLQTIECEKLSLGQYGQKIFNTETTTHGRLEIADTGAMEIKGDYCMLAYNAVKKSDGSWEKGIPEIYKYYCINPCTASLEETKYGKIRGERDTGFWIGFMPFCLTLYLDYASYDQAVKEGFIEKEDIPTVETPRNYVNKSGYNLRQREENLMKQNLDPTVKLKNAIAHYRGVFSRYKAYYDSLTEAEKEEAHSKLISAIQSIKSKGWKDIDLYINYTEYIPGRYRSPTESSGGSSSSSSSGGAQDNVIDEYHEAETGGLPDDNDDVPPEGDDDVSMGTDTVEGDQNNTYWRT